MRRVIRFLPLTLSAVMLAKPAFGGHNEMEEIVVQGNDTGQSKLTIDSNFEAAPIDTAALLRTLPGANVNSNGPVTGIVQYRGLYGDRVSVHVDHAPALTGGPNAMDTPLSYTPSLLLKELGLHRGMVSVSAAQESLGGHITAELDRGDFSSSDNFSITGTAANRFNDSSNGNSSALKATVANQQHKWSILGSHDEGDDTEAGDSDTIGGSQYRRSRYDLGYGWQNGETTVQVYAGQLDTRNSGTPALPMDINFIESDLAGFKGSTAIGEAKVSASFAYSHVEHGMDNFSQRQAPASPMMYRFNHATALGKSWKLQAEWPMENGSLTIGTDGNLSVHNSEISNPNNDMFILHNFNDTERDIMGIFAEWKGHTSGWNIETGLRYNHVEMDASEVSINGLMGMMAMNANLLATIFNDADRSLNYDNIDVVVKAETSLSDMVTLQLGLGRKNRAPSYQELYLWLPLTATGGLADGRNYTGNLDLDSETANEVTAGIQWQNDKGWASPQVFYRRIEDYIQGVPSTNPTANMVSTMMSGQSALMFDNIDAEMHGFDMAYGYQLSEHLSLTGNLSYVRGKRTDESDNLYRVAPLNHRLAITYQGHNKEGRDWSLTAESVLNAKQNKTSTFNDELESSGYGIVNLTGQYAVSANIDISAGIGNVFDKRYQDHLAGYNRNGGSDILLGDRLPGAGRNTWLAVTVNW